MFNAGNVPTQSTYQGERVNLVGAGAPADPVIRERIDGYVKRIYNCLNYAQQIEGKIFNPTPSNCCPSEKGPATIEGLLYELDRISLDLEDTLARVNNKL